MNKPDKIAEELEKRFEQPDIDYTGFEWFYESHLTITREEANELLQHYPEADSELVEIAALMHDVGYLRSTENHEEIGPEIAEQIIEDLGIELEDERLDHLKHIIRQHGYEGQPETLEADIVRCADAIAHLRPVFIAAKSRVEYEKGKSITEFMDWTAEKTQKCIEKASALPEAEQKIKVYAESFESILGGENHG